MPERLYTFNDIFWPAMGAFLGVLHLYEKLEGRPKWHRVSVILSSAGGAILLALACKEFWQLGDGAVGLIAWLGGNLVSTVVDQVLQILRDTDWIKAQLAALIPGKSKGENDADR
jgi:hypothetical protein